MAAESPGKRVSVVIPCFNEAETVGACVRAAFAALNDYGDSAEVIVVDNGSTDGSGDLARAAGALVIDEPMRGYGNAYQAGFSAAQGDYVVMADADLTYDFREIPRFVAELDSGADLVMGERLHAIHPGAMPWLNRYVGNPMMTALMNLIFRTGLNDAWCGMRAVRREILSTLDLRASGMEFALEMVVRASLEQLDIREIPIELRRRGGTSKLKPFRDGWRALHLLLMYSPRLLFMLPGILMALLGSFLVSAGLAQLSVFGRHWYLHTVGLGAVLVLAGVQVLGLGLCGQAYAHHFLHNRGTLFGKLQERGIRLKHGLLLGAGLVLAAAILAAAVFTASATGDLGRFTGDRLAVVAAILFIVGAQCIFTSFLLSMLGLRRRHEWTARD